MHDRLVSRRIDALHQCFFVYVFVDDDFDVCTQERTPG